MTSLRALDRLRRRYNKERYNLEAAGKLPLSHWNEGELLLIDRHVLGRISRWLLKIRS